MIHLIQIQKFRLQKFRLLSKEASSDVELLVCGDDLIVKDCIFYKTWKKIDSFCI